MRIIIASLAAALIAGLTFPAEAAPKKKHRHAADKTRVPAEGRARAGKDHELGYDASPEHYRVGTREWWQAMDKQGRGGFGDTP